MQYSDIMGMLFYEFQNVLETYSKILEERREEEEKEYAENGYDKANFSPNNMMKGAQSYMSKIPNMPQMPKFDIPKL